MTFASTNVCKFIRIALIGFMTLACSKNPLSESDSDRRSDVVLEESQKKYARIRFEHTSYDFGKVGQGALVQHTFKFVNDGDTSLIITNASASCGCTVPQWPKQAIVPGDTGSIFVQFNTTGKSGIQNKTVMITANTLPNITSVALKGEVEGPQLQNK